MCIKFSLIITWWGEVRLRTWGVNYLTERGFEISVRVIATFTFWECVQCPLSRVSLGLTLTFIFSYSFSNLNQSFSFNQKINNSQSFFIFYTKFTIILSYTMDISTVASISWLTRAINSFLHNQFFID